MEEQTNKDLLDEINDQYDDFKHRLEIEEKHLIVPVKLTPYDDLDDIFALINSNKSVEIKQTD